MSVFFIIIIWNIDRMKLFAIVSNSNVSPLKIILDIVEFSFCLKNVKRKSRRRMFQRKLNIIWETNIGCKIEVNQRQIILSHSLHKFIHFFLTGCMKMFWSKVFTMNGREMIFYYSGWKLIFLKSLEWTTYFCHHRKRFSNYKTLEERIRNCAKRGTRAKSDAFQWFKLEDIATSVCMCV